jgi:hypothetical protein
MSRETEQIIEQLTQLLRPARPLPRPYVRAAAWLAISLGYIAVVFVLMPRDRNLLSQNAHSSFAIEQVAALITGFAAAMAALITIIPGRDRRWAILPVLPLSLWLCSLAPSCLREFSQIGLQALFMRHNLWCVPSILLFGTVPAIAMLLMLRRGAPLTPHITAALGGLAAAGVGNVGVRLVHPEDVSVMLVLWHVGGVMLLSAIASCAGRSLFNWRSITGGAKSAVQ